MGNLHHPRRLPQGHARVGRQGSARRLLRGALVAAGLALAALGSPQEGTSGARFDDAKAYGLMLRQCAFGYRIPGTKPHDDCRDYLKAELAKSCDHVFTQHFSHTWSVSGKSLPMDNVVGDINWDKATTRVVLVTHWDTRPFADQDPNPENRHKPILGADDAASGTAVLIELARVLKAHPLDPSVGVRMLLVDGEDLGPGSNEMYLGSIAYGKTPGPRGDYGILLDMIGDKDQQIPMEQSSTRLVPKLQRAVYEFAKTVDPLVARAFPARVGDDIEDDHLALIQGGLPTVDLIDFDYPYWHTVEDTPDKISAVSLGNVGRLLDAWLRRSPAWRP